VLGDPRAVEVALARVADRLRAFPGYAQIRAVHLSLAPWTVENGLITPTMKLKRSELETRFATVIDALYERQPRTAASSARP